MSEDDFYSVLGVERTSEHWLIHLKYRELMRRYHPDAGTEPNTDRAQLVNEAFGVLGDPEKRRRYDAELATETPTRTKTEPVAASLRTPRKRVPPADSIEVDRRPAFSDTAIILWLLAFCLAITAFLYFGR